MDFILDYGVIGDSFTEQLMINLKNLAVCGILNNRWYSMSLDNFIMIPIKINWFRCILFHLFLSQFLLFVEI